MKEFPYLEEIYDLETEQLESLLTQLDQDLLSGGQCELPKGFDSYEKFERKALKLKEHLELELEERKQVDDVISFFVGKSDRMDLLSDDQFYQPPQKSLSETRPPQAEVQDTDRESIYSGQETQSDTVSISDGGASSDLSQKMFANRGKMSKKDMEQFMREKLQKTKVASEATTQASSFTGQVTKKNFTKSKTKEVSDTESQKTYKTTKTTAEKQTIYKPNLRKNINSSQSSQKPSKTEQKASSISRVASSDKEENPKPAPKTEKPVKVPSIYKPPAPMKRNSSKPPVPKTVQATPISSQRIDIVQQPVHQDSHKELDKWHQSEEDKEESDLIDHNNEEIESKYSDSEIDCLPSDASLNPPQLLSELTPQSFVKDSLVDDSVQATVTKTAQNQNQEDQVEVRTPVNELIDHSQAIQPTKQERTSEQSSAEEDDGFYSVTDSISNMKKLIPNANGPQKESGTTATYNESMIHTKQEPHELVVDRVTAKPSLTVQVGVESTTSRKIRGKVQIFVDEEALSAQQTPKISIDTQQYNLKQQELDEQVASLDKVIKIDQVPPKQISKGLSLIKTITAQDESKKKQEQEERLQLIRDQMRKEKELQAAAQKPQEPETVVTNAQEKEGPTKKESQPIEAKPKREKKGLPGAKPTKKKVEQVEKIPKHPVEADMIVDYSAHYKSFYDIFVGQILDPKGFDLSFVMRDTRNLYASFVNIMDVNALTMKRKHVFEQAPTEKALQDYYSILPNNHLMLTGKSLNDLELEMKNRGNEIMMLAMNQAQLKDRFQQLKNKDVNDIVKEAQQKSGGDNQIIDPERESSLYFRVVKNRTEVYDIISRGFSRKKRWNELPHGLDLRNSWNFLWTWSKIKIDISKLLVWQKCNHFNGAKNVSRKDFLKRNIERAQKMTNKSFQVFNIIPQTFILPKEYVPFMETFSEYEEKEGSLNYWIMKPAAKSRGRGISLVNDLSAITYGEPIVVQRYIKNPLLINGYKFDMRIYVLVTSVNPLEAFLYKEGFGRFSTMPFSLDPSDKGNKYIHLTNVSIQKYNINNCERDASDVIYGGSKISLQTLKKRLQGVSSLNWDEQIWPQMRDVIVKSLVACQNDIQFNPCCFELFGYDILIDSNFKCWLIEINSSPSLARETLLDDMVKQRLIDDTIDLLDPLDFDRKRLFEVLERRVGEDFKQNANVNAHTKRTMNKDLTYILNGQVPRKYGEMPKMMGNYERIAPSQSSDQYLKIIGGQKMFGSLMKMPVGEPDKS